MEGDGRNVAEVIQYAIVPAAVGSALIAQSKHGVCALLLGDDEVALRKELRTEFPQATLKEAAKELERLASRARALVDAPSERFDETLDLRGTDTQQRVWRALQEVPAGARVTYAALAKKLGVSRGERSVAGACAANCIAVAIPCHRVVLSDDALAGYRWGIERKRWLLEREASS